MAWYLYRLGRWSFRHRWLVLGLWVGLLVLAGVGASTLAGKTSDEFSIPDMESTEAFELISERTPGAAIDGATARIAFEAPDGERLTSDENRRLVLETIEAAESESVVGTSQPFREGTISDDGRVAYATVSFADPAIELPAEDLETLESAPEQARDAGLTVAIGGDALQEIPEQGTAELIGIGIAIVVLTVTFGSLLVAGMPLFTALVGVGIGIAGITTLTGFVDLGSTTPILATMLGLAVGIDYALFIVSRYRTEVRDGRPPEQAAGRAVGTAGSAVVFAGLTVIIALTGLSVVGISFLTEMGLAAAATVGVAVLIALTMLPALLGLLGRRVLRRAERRAMDDGEPLAGDRRTAGRRWAELVTRHKALTFSIGIAVAVVLAIPVASMQLSLPDDGRAEEGSGPRVAYDLIAENFGEGTNGPLLVVADTSWVVDPRPVTGEVISRLEGVDGLAEVIPPPGPPEDATAEERAVFEEQYRQARYVTITAIPESGPSDLATQELVDEIRSELDGIDGRVDVYVSGQTAVGVDISENLARAFPQYLAVVVGLAFALLTAVFRSVLVPLKAVLGFLLSVGIALGVTVAVFQWGWGAGLIGVDTPGPVLFMLPLLLTGILFGLAMDYEVFLVTRMREEYVHGQPATRAVVHGFAHGARVVTAAAAIMFGVFGGFALGDDAVVKSIGFGLAIGILADAFLVRMTLVPALMALVGDRMWWLPRWLDRLLPNLDVEGETLTRRLDHERPETDSRTLVGVR